jgi:hypothetical protein
LTRRTQNEDNGNLQNSDHERPFFHGESQKITLELKKNISKKETAFFYFILHTLKRSATASAEINREIG